MAIVQFDHSVLVVDEQDRARDFYIDYLGAAVHHTFVREGRVPGKTFHRSLLVLNSIGHGLGLFEDRDSVPTPKEAREFATVVFRVSLERYARAVNELGGVEAKLPIPGAEMTLYTHDTEGNPIGFSAGAGGRESFMLRLELDIARLEEATSFYEEVFGLPRTETGVLPDDGQRPYGWFAIGTEGQGVFVVEDPDAPSANHGHHYAFSLRQKSTLH